MAEVIGKPIPASEWNREFHTDQGESIVRALEPLHTSPIVLKPETNEVERTAGQLYEDIGLRCESGTRVISSKLMREDLSYAGLFLLRYPTSNLGRELIAAFDRSMTYGFSPFLDDHLDARYRSIFREDLAGYTYRRIEDMLNSSLFAAIHDPMLTSLSLALQTVKTHMWNTFRQAVVYEVLQLAQGNLEEVVKLARVVTFFVNGNYLLGRTNENLGVVLTA